jgi:hypothetical protein
VAGEEELRARAMLDEMQMRISRGPYDALGLSEYATSDDVRSAFLAATKKFHPARFGRMSPDLQKLANEVFLGIKGAHDHLQRILGGSMTRPGIGASSSSQAIPQQTQHGVGTGKTPAPQLLRRTGQMPPLEQNRPSGQHRAQLGTSPPSTQPHSQPIARPGTPPARAATPPMNTPAHGMQRPITPPMNTPAHGMQRPATPPMNTPAHGMQRPGTPPVRPTPASGIPIQRPGTPPVRPTPASGIPIQRPGTPPVGARPNTPQPGARPTTPAGRPQTPPTTPPRPSSDLKPPTQPPRPSSDLKPPTSPPRGFDINPPTVRGVQPAAAFDERSALRESMMLLNDRNWGAARQALHNLAAKVPQSKSYRALLCYARGRETQAAGRPDEALLEFQRALQLEPTLDLATQAIAELRRR